MREAINMKISLNIDVSCNNGILVITDQVGQVVTFSKDQVVQKKVSMITLGEFTDLPKIQVAKAFGFSTRKSYYDIRQTVLNGQPADLIPHSTGPKSPTKRTSELEIMVITMRFKTDKNMYEIAEVLKQSGHDVSSRLVGQILSDFGLSKKKRF